MKRIISLMGAFACAACALAADQLNVVATLPDLASVAAVVGGQHVKVTSLANPSEDPHFVDPKPSFARVLNKADILVEGGAELESGWLAPIVENARNPRILPGRPGDVAGATGIQLKEKPAPGADRSQGDVHPSGNPHYLMEPDNAATLARALAQRFAQLQPANAPLFAANAEKFNDALKEALPDWEKKLAPARGAKVISYHRTFTYFLDRFGLQLVDTIEPKPGVEPSPSHVAHLIKTGRDAGVKVVLIEGNRSRRTPERIAADIGAKVVVLEHMPQPTADGYIKWIEGMVDAVAKGFGGP